MKTYRFRTRVDTPAYSLPAKANRTFKDLPGPSASWLTGHLARLIGDDEAYVYGMAKTYGNVFCVPGFFGKNTVFMVGAQANELVLGNASKNFSNHHAYYPLRGFVGESIVTRDSKDHAELRKLVSTSFSGRAMVRYLEHINRLCEKNLQSLEHDKSEQVNIYPFVKAYALEVAIEVFAGVAHDEVEPRIGSALHSVLELSRARLPLMVPGSIYYRGKRGRALAEKYFRTLIPLRREAQQNDLFSRLCTAENDVGERLSDQDVIDNAIGIMIAGHDTSTIAIVSLLIELANSTKEQQKLRKKCRAIFRRTGANVLPHAEVTELSDVDLCVKEALRLHTPIRYIQRRAVKRFTFQGHDIPANSNVIVSLHHSHLNEEYFEHASRFLPQRFSDDTTLRKAPKFAWAPFGKGAHLCLGMQFALLEAKAFIYQILLKYEIQIDPKYEYKLTGLPLSRPKDGVPIRLVEIAN